MNSVAATSITVIFFLGLLLLALRFLSRKSFSVSFGGKHCIVTGGSSGIGKSIATKLSREGAHVTIVARNVEKLRHALVEIRAHALNPSLQKFNFISSDLGLSSYDEIEKSFSDVERNVGPIFALFNVAGYAVPLPLDELPVSSFEGMLRLNLLASMNTTRAVVPGMKRRGSGVIVFTSSMAGLMGLYGYSVYSATKFGLRGFAEALSMELTGHGISVSISFPPDTLTPGFEAENKMKNPVTAKISADGSVFSSDNVCENIVDGVKRGHFTITSGFDGWLTFLGCSSFSPNSSTLDSLFSVLFGGLIRFVALGYLYRWYGFARKFQTCGKC